MLDWGQTFANEKCREKRILIWKLSIQLCFIVFENDSCVWKYWRICSSKYVLISYTYITVWCVQENPQYSWWDHFVIVSFYRLADNSMKLRQLMNFYCVMFTSGHITQHSVLFTCWKIWCKNILIWREWAPSRPRRSTDLLHCSLWTSSVTNDCNFFQNPDL